MNSMTQDGTLVIESDVIQTSLTNLLEGYLYGLGEACHRLFGPKGEVAMYEAVGSVFLNYLRQKRALSLSPDPWERYCQIVTFFTSQGFYSRVELRQLAENKYWMLETGQFAGSIWEELNAWGRGTPPCPLWSVILYALAEIGYSVVLDTVNYIQEVSGYDSTFHFVPREAAGNVFHVAKDSLHHSLLPTCANCHKIRTDDGAWVDSAIYFTRRLKLQLTHDVCPTCLEQLYPDLMADD